MSEHPLTAWRRTHGLKQTDVAARLEVSIATVSRIESGKKNPSFALIRRIVVLTNGEVSADDLIGVKAA